MRRNTSAPRRNPLVAETRDQEVSFDHSVISKSCVVLGGNECTVTAAKLAISDVLQSDYSDTGVCVMC